MFEAEMLNQQLERLQEYLGNMDRQAAEITALKSAIDAWSSVPAGDEMLVPIAAGVFAHAHSSVDKTLRVNVGNNTVVAKTVPEMHVMLDTQLTEMRTYEEELHKQFDQLLARLGAIEAEFNAMTSATSK